MANDLPQDVIPLETAQQWAANWNQEGANYLANNALKAFLIPGADIQGIIKDDNTYDIRGYLGLEKLSDGSFEPHMMVVGVDNNQNDMIDYDKGYYIYDFSLPCPNTCDTSSPLFVK
ncbi:conserved hypothetical protein [Flavobacterium sp. 9AF]|uniref:hypothetical protein n=1 Tax=Flavobacterium sp. 9AF TaxID=2653142 RepID=UPI0012F35707|nr:hypothetical protein [Flavobacterium sp. 9AF]VXC11324.1 conserved hypothetical protein [Flavobacterium sp. 9AF]